MKRRERYTVGDGRLTLRLEAAEKGYVVTCPGDRAVITHARTLREAFAKSRRALAAARQARADAEDAADLRIARRAMADAKRRGERPIPIARVRELLGLPSQPEPATHLRKGGRRRS